MGVGFGILKTSGSGGGGGGTTITTVANYSALPLATAVSGKFYWCEASQGTKWLPFSVGGTYYPLGMYYSNGVTWEYSETPYQATLSEVNTGTNTDKFVSPYTFTSADKWNNYTLKTTTISTTSPLAGGGDLSANRTFTISQANTTTDGYLSSTDWNTFNLKGNGTVTSVGLSMPSAFTVSNSPIISSGTINVIGAGTTAEYIRGDGTLATFPALTGYVPYVGATTNVDLGTFNLTADHITLNTNPSGAGFVVGTTEWNNTDGTSQTLLKGGNVILKNGVDLVAYVVNKTGINLLESAYQVVQVSSAVGGRLSVTLAQANNDGNSVDTLGIVTETINNNLEGFILTMGQLLDINTTGSLQGETWVDGDVLYLSTTTAGAITNIKPTAITGHLVVLGYVEYAHINNGKIYVKIMNGWELDELHNVYINNPINKNILSYVTPANLWENQTLGQVIGGVASQYVRGDGSVATFPTSTGGGSSVAYYLNGGTSQGTIGGSAYYQMSKSAVIGTNADFSLTNTTGYIAQFITDLSDPSLLSIPQGAWNFYFYFNASDTTTAGSFYVELYKYDGATFTLISSSSASLELITNGTAIDLYTTSTAVPLTTLTLTDRLAVRVFVNTNGNKTITLYTQDSHLCEIVTTFSTGINTLNSLSSQVQYFTVGTSGTDFNISSVTDTHTFNLPFSSATNSGKLSSVDWGTFNGKQNTISLTTGGTSGASTFISNTLNIPEYTLSGLGGVPTTRQLTINGTAFDLSANRSWTVGTVTSVSALTIGTTGTDITSTVANGTTTPTITLNVPTASATNRGALSSTDWSTFSGKQDALTIGNITDIGTDGITITGGTGAIIGSGVAISQQVASASQNGYLSSTDWNTFNSAAPPFIPSLTGNETYRGISINNNSTTVISDGGVVMSSSASTLAQAVSSTNFATKQIRLRYYASTVSGGRYTGTRGSALLWYIHGGFKFVCDFNISDTSYSAGCQQFYGLAGQITDLAYGTATGILVSTLTNIIGVGNETGDANLQVFHNDATGTATKIDLGIDFPANRTVGAISTTVYSIKLYNECMSTDVKYEVKNNETGSIANGTISTNLPLTSQGLNFFASRCMSATSVTNTGQFDLSKLGVYSLL
jgi:hypothetical protein